MEARAVLRVRHVVAFLWAQKAWVVLGPALMLLGTALHEGAHALAVVLAGGAVDSIVLWPRLSSRGVTFGSTWHHGVPGHRMAWVALAPFVTAHAHALAGSLVVARGRGRLARVLFFTSVLLPLFDVSMPHAGLFLGARHSDLGGFGAHALGFGLAGGPVLVGLGLLALRAFRRHWGPPQGLTATEFGVLLAMFLASAWLA